jgi:hypothetical protein
VTSLIETRLACFVQLVPEGSGASTFGSLGERHDARRTSRPPIAQDRLEETPSVELRYTFRSEAEEQ